MIQVRALDLKNNVFVGGMIMDNHDFICGCCGSIISKNEIAISDTTEYDSGQLMEAFKKVYPAKTTSNTLFKIEHVYKTWMNLTETITGVTNNVKSFF